MRYGIDMGHCLKGFDSGSQGNGYKEENLTRLVGNKVIAKLQALGHIVINCTVDSANGVQESLNLRYSKANSNNVDLFVSIHLNASDGQGHGVEIFTYGAKETKEGINILKKISALGYANRGIKDGSKLAVIKNTKASAMLIECCFIDNSADIRIFNAEKIADAIVNGLTGLSTTIVPAVSTTNVFKTVTASVLNIRRGPGTQYATIGEKKKGDVVQVGKTSGGWTDIYFGDHGGYVSAQYLK